MGRLEKDIEVKASLPEFFYQQVKQAMEKQKVSLSETSEWYAVNLLSHYAGADDPDADSGEPDLQDLPVSIAYYRLMAQSLPHKIKGYKTIGDSTLFLSGFFSDSLMRKLVDIDYYMDFGMRSYEALARIYDAEYWDKTRKELFEELTREFRTLVDIFADVRDATDIECSGGLLRLYERWARTRSKRDELLLQAEGILPNHNVDLRVAH